MKLFIHKLFINAISLISVIKIIVLRRKFVRINVQLTFIVSDVCESF